MTNNIKKSPKYKAKNIFGNLQKFKDSLDQEELLLQKEISSFGGTFEEFLTMKPHADLDQAELSYFLELQERYKNYLERREKIDRIVIINPAKLGETVTAAEKILFQNSKNHNIYQRSGKLVRVTQHKDDNEMLKRSADAYIIREIEQAFLTLFLNEAAYYVQYNKQKKEYKQVICKENIARYVLARQEWKIPSLHGVINAPTLRSDGTILDEPGYDKRSGLLFLPGDYQFEKIPKHPSKDDALKAADTLLKVLCEFPFANEISRSVALAAILTSIVRRSIATAPLFGFTAPKMGSGKTLLADVVSIIATGKPNSVISQSENEAEEKKRLLGILLEGDPIVCYDNVERPFGGPTICAILTQEEYKDRKLGGNETRSVPTHITFLVTGNNLVFIGDTSTRTLLCKLDPQVERPEERSFSIENLRSFVIEHRATLVASGIIILRAYEVAQKLNIQPFGRFEEWSNRVRSAIIWLGFEDPCDSRKEIENADPVRIALSLLFSSWHAIFGSRAIKIKEVVDTIKSDPQYHHDPIAHEQLREVVMELSSNSKREIDSQKLAGKLRSYKDRIEHGFKLQQLGVSQGTTLWLVKKIES